MWLSAMQFTVLFPLAMSLPTNLWFQLSPQCAPLKVKRGQRNSGGQTQCYGKGASVHVSMAKDGCSLNSQRTATAPGVLGSGPTTSKRGLLQNLCVCPHNPDKSRTSGLLAVQQPEPTGTWRVASKNLEQRRWCALPPL